MLTLILAILPSLQASTDHSGLLLPGAAQVASQGGQVDLGAADLPVLEGEPPVHTAWASMTLSPTSRISLQGLAGVSQDDPGGSTGGGLLGAGGRWLVVNNPVLRLAPIGFGLFRAEHDEGAWSNPSLLLAGAGVATEMGAKVAFLDASVLLVTWDHEKTNVVHSFGDVFPTSEFGLNVVPAEGHDIRVGTVAGMPNVSYRYEHKHLYGRIAIGGALTEGHVVPGAMAQAGVSF